MTSWRELFGPVAAVDGRPVPGDPEEFLQAQRYFTQIQEGVDEIVQTFSRIGRGSDVFDGSAAEAFGQLLDEVDERLINVPWVAKDISEAFRDHRTRLTGYRTAEANLYARTVTAWESWKSATSDLTAATARVSGLQAQLDELQALATPSPEEPAIDSNLTSAKWHVTSCETAVSAAESALRAHHKTYASLHDDAVALDEETATKLDDIELWNLADPSMLEKGAAFVAEKWQGFENWWAEFAEDLVAIFDAVVRGDWDEALYKLNDVLDKVATIVMVIGIVVAILASGGALAGAAALAAKLALMSKGLDLAQVAVSATLYGAQTLGLTDEEQRVGGGEVLLDAFGAFVKVPGAKQAKTGHHLKYFKSGEKHFLRGFKDLSGHYLGAEKLNYSALGRAWRDVGALTFQHGGHHAGKLSLAGTVAGTTLDNWDRVEPLVKHVGGRVAGDGGGWTETGIQRPLPGLRSQLRSIELVPLDFDVPAIPVFAPVGAP